MTSGTSSTYNVVRYLHHAASRWPTATALSEDKNYRITFAELSQRVDSLADLLLNSAQLLPGDRVALFASNRASYVEAMFACWCAGLVVVPINFQLHPEEVGYIVDDSGARLCLGSGDQLDVLRHLADQRQLQCQFCDIDLPETWSASVRDCDDEVNHDLAWLFYTSGTTGKPKGVMITHDNLRQVVLNYLADIEHISPGHSIQHYGPLSHASGFYVLPHLARGAANVVVRELEPSIETVMTLSECFGPATFFMAPTSLQRLLSTLDAPLRTHLIRTIATGGGTLHVPLAKKVNELIPGKLVQVYGQGESPMTITVMPATEMADAAQNNDEDRLRSVGRAFTGVEVSLRSEDGSAVEEGSAGEIVVRGPTLMQGYWKRPGASAETIRDGWLYTGDIGRIDAQGYVTILDRSKDVVISGGMNIYSREIEDLLMSHPAVNEVAIVGVPDDEWGEVVVACIALVPGASSCDQALDALCLKHLARFKRPKRYIYFEALPKNNYGKILKRELRESSVAAC